MSALGDFAPVERRTVSGQVRDQLLERILAGELPPGDRIPAERVLCEQFDVARTSVREGIQGLVSLGYITRRGNRAYVVEHLPEVGHDARKATVRELFETRRALELPMARLAAHRATLEQRRGLCRSADRFVPGLELAEFRRLDRGFHWSIAGACGNRLMGEVYAKVLDALFGSDEFDQLLSASANRGEVAAIMARSGEEHRGIAAALDEGDADAVECAIALHLDHVEGSMIDRLV